MAGEIATRERQGGIKLMAYILEDESLFDQSVGTPESRAEALSSRIRLYYAKFSLRKTKLPLANGHYFMGELVYESDPRVGRELIRMAHAQLKKLHEVRKVGDTKGMCALENRLAEIAGEFGDFVEAQTLYKGCYVKADRLYSKKDHEAVQSALVGWATVLYERDQCDAALPLFDEALRVRRAVSETKDVNLQVVEVLQRIADCYSKMNNNKEARKYFEQVVVLFPQLYDEPEEYPIEYARAFAGLGLCMTLAKKLDVAKHCYTRTLEITRQVYRGKDDHGKTGKCLLDLGLITQGLRQYVEAIEFLTEAINTLQAQFGSKGHIHLATSLSTLGKVHLELKQYDSGRALFEEAIKMFKEVKGTDDCAEVATGLHQLAEISRLTGDTIGSKKLYEKAINIYTRVHGKRIQKDILKCLTSLGDIYMEEKNMATAKTYFEESLEINKKINQQSDPLEMSRVANKLAFVVEQLGNVTRARQLIELAIECKRKGYGTLENEDIALSLHNLGLVLKSMGEYDNSLEHLEKSLDIYKKLSTTDGDENVLRGLKSLGLVYEKLNRLEDAKQTFEMVLEIDQIIKKGELDQDSAGILEAIGNVVHQLEDIPASLDLYQQVGIIREQLNEKQNDETVFGMLYKIHERVGELHETMGEPKKMIQSYLTSYRNLLPATTRKIRTVDVVSDETRILLGIIRGHRYMNDITPGLEMVQDAFAVQNGFKDGQKRRIMDKLGIEKCLYVVNCCHLI
eukprot:TRINITY_DN1103_c0_g3_i1.p1 TRINITY_DN1103_c0_g3~~TRINITY_DN1103_c0_g3_i1.p1  ORF type:complete len:740 (+),score=255.07 TRINITY_DN1103_c0_g3_i1:1253-3472(+)